MIKKIRQCFSINKKKGKIIFLFLKNTNYGKIIIITIINSIIY